MLNTNCCFSFLCDYLISGIIGGVIGLILVFLVEWIKKPRICFVGFERTNFNKPNYLYKLKIKVYGCWVYPGLSELNIKSKNIDKKDINEKAKWDDNPNPLKDDNHKLFEPALVPQTMNTNIFKKGIYTISVPVIHEDENGKLTIFSGWWFGIDKGYRTKSSLTITEDSEIKFVFSSQNSSIMEDTYTVKDIIEKAETN